MKAKESVSNRFDTDSSEENAKSSKKRKSEPEPKLLDLDAPESPFNFETSARKGKSSRFKPIREDLGQIVKTIFVNDLHATWQRLHDGLSIGVNRSNHGTLQRALDRAEKNARDAHRVYMTAHMAKVRWEHQNAVVWSAMWSEATRSLQREKDDGQRAKQITDADIKARAMTLHPDEFAAQEIAKEEIKSVVELLKDLSEQWKSRCQTLRSMLGKLRG